MLSEIAGRWESLQRNKFRGSTIALEPTSPPGRLSHLPNARMAEFDCILGCNLGKPRCRDVAGFTVSTSRTWTTPARRAERTRTWRARNGTACDARPCLAAAPQRNQAKCAARPGVRQNSWESLQGQSVSISCRAQSVDHWPMLSKKSSLEPISDFSIEQASDGF